jgi:hypothetical protein
MAVLMLLIGSHYDVIPLFYISMILAGYGAGSTLPGIYVYVEKLMSKKWADLGIIWVNGFG